MDTMLEEIEKKQFELRYQSIADILTVIKKCGKEIMHGLVLK